MSSFRRCLFSQGIVATMILLGAALMAGCGSSEAPVAAGPKVEAPAVLKTVGKGKNKVPVESRREHKKEQAKAAE